MWTFPILLFLCFLTYFPTAWIIRAVSPGFWVWSVTRAHILIAEKTVPEIETTVYIASFIIGMSIFFILFQFVKYFRHVSWFQRMVIFVNTALGVYFLIVPARRITDLDQIQMIFFLPSVCIGVVAGRLKKFSSYILEAVIGLGIVRYCFGPIIELDIGKTNLYTFDGYLRYGVLRAPYPLALGILLIWKRKSAAVRELCAWFTYRRLSVLLLSCIALSLLYLMTNSHHPSDMFFTMLPAYHALHGGTLLVSVMSQYGLLYLAPWMVWLSLFPQAPVSFPVGTFVSAILLFLYFCLLVSVISRLVPRRLFIILTVVASYYFTILIRYTGLSDMVSLVSTPAFTPLRFGIFIIPLWFLIRMRETVNIRFLYYFIVSSFVLFFYSFEIGAGLIAVALVIAGVYAVTLASDRNVVWKFAGVLAATAVSCMLILTAYTRLSADSYPDFSMFWQIATLYGSGFLTTPMGKQRIIMLILCIAGIGLFTGIVRLIQDKKHDGLIFCYLALIQFAMLPYYTGRSMYQTVFSISLPLLLLCTLLLERGIVILRADRQRFTAWAIVIVCGTVLVTGWARGTVILIRTMLHSAEIIEATSRYLYAAFTRWDVQSSKESRFLSKHLPAGCPLIAFDAREFELFAALGVPPAFQYAFVYGFITSKEQVDRLVPHRGAPEICIFVSDAFLKQKDMFSYGMYRYFFSKHRTAMAQIAQDNEEKFALYRLPSNVFDRKR